MRRKPSSQNSGGYNNQSRKPHYRGGQNQNHNNHNRPRKNYAASREKYLSQAREALASGDRVLAENYFQHAEHCYRMMVEEGYHFRTNYQSQGAGESNEAGEAVTENTSEAAQPQEDGLDTEAPAQLPAFLTANFARNESVQAGAATVAEHWEE